MSPKYVLTTNCEGTIGTVSLVSTFLAENNCYISEMAQFDDTETQQFFMRTEFRIEGENSPSIEQLTSQFSALAERHNIEWAFQDLSVKPKVIIMVSKLDHCLNDLLYRYRTGELAIEIPMIISNHKDLEGLAKWHGIRFEHLPITPDIKLEQEAKLSAFIDETESELLVLARYMQVLTDDFCQKRLGKIINIHHSFLPSFKGEKPYHQAHKRGVKIIGATAHYVTPDLDEGPIIEQMVERINHNYQPIDMVKAGRDTESLTLARAIKLHIEHRVFLNNQNKTVVFS